MFGAHACAVLVVALGVAVAVPPGVTVELAPAASQDEPVPVVLSPEVVDLGSATFGEPASGSFELRNAGERPVRVARIVSSCACLAAEAPAGEVAPGRSVRVPVTLTPGTKPGERVTKTLTVEFEGLAPRSVRVSAVVAARRSPWGAIAAVAGGIAAVALLARAAFRAR